MRCAVAPMPCGRESGAYRRIRSTVRPSCVCVEQELGRLKIAGVDVVATAKATFKEFQADDLQGRSAQVAYNVLFSVVPLLIFLTALSGFIARAAGVDDAMDSITTWLFDHMGTTQANAVREPIETVVKSNNGGLLSVGAVLALWGGKNAVAAVMKALNVAYNVEEGRSFIKRNLVAIGLTVALGLSITLVSAVFLAGAGIADNITERIGLGETWQLVWSYLRWPVIAAILIVAVSVLYWAAPNRDAPFKYLTPGSVLSVFGWGIVTAGIGFYFANFAGYAGGTYGALGGVLVFLFWLNLMALILLIGAELNSVLLAQKAMPVVEKDASKSSASSSPSAATGTSTKPVVSPSPAQFATATATPTPTQPVSSVPRGTSQAGFTASSKPSKSQSTWLLTLTMMFARVLLSGRRLMKRFNSSDKR
jgi:membrane protein